MLLMSNILKHANYINAARKSGSEDSMFLDNKLQRSDARHVNTLSSTEAFNCFTAADKKRENASAE